MAHDQGELFVSEKPSYSGHYGPRREGEYILYDGRPPRVDEDTSGAAADSIRPILNHLQEAVLDVLRDAPGGMTCDSVEAALSGRHQTISARVRELVLLGEIEDSGERRKTRSGRTARVYVVTR